MNFYLPMSVEQIWLHQQPKSLLDYVKTHPKDQALLNRLRQLFEYDAEEGVLVWKIERKGTKGIGSPAGSFDKSTNRRVVTIDGKNYKHSRLVYLYHHGYLANFQIDHFDRNPSNDRIENLRAVTASQNNVNKLSKLVYQNPNGTFSVKLSINQVFKHIGTFDCKQEAIRIAKLSHAIVNAEHSPHHWELIGQPVSTFAGGAYGM